MEWGCMCPSTAGQLCGHFGAQVDKWVAQGWESLWCAHIHGVSADLAWGMPSQMSTLGSFSLQRRAEHPGSC